MVSLSEEQQRIVEHDRSASARVLAVAGSGKTTAMVHRVAALVSAPETQARDIRVVMYNRAAREHFERELSEVGVRGVRVLTFHALGNSIVRWAEGRQLIEPLTLMKDASSIRRLATRAWHHAREELNLEEVGVELDEAMSAVGYWKAQLVSPERAFHHNDRFYDAFYRAWEGLRRERGVRTFDDQLGEAVQLFEGEHQDLVQEVLSNRIEHLIVDEYQDVNPAQVRLLQHIAGTRARVMVVGDDDQCIYEWRGASPAFIGPRFATDFPAHEHVTYTLSRTFRFGPPIAACASQVIERNEQRVQKTLISARPELDSRVVLLDDEGPEACIGSLLSESVAPSDIAVLVRSYHQSYQLQAALSSRRIPYLVDGERPFVDAPPVELLADYLHVLAAWHDPLSADLNETWLRVLNRPMRYVKKQAFAEALEDFARQGASPADVFARPAALTDWGVHRAAISQLRELGRAMKKAWKEALKGGAGAAARRLVREVAFDEVFSARRGRRNDEEARVQQLAFCDLLSAARIQLSDVGRFIEDFDPTLGEREERCVRITTVFQSKGLAWPYVVLPELVDGAFPDVRAEDFAAFGSVDDAEEGADQELSKRTRRQRAIEAERRLFYVALTRARKRVFLAVPSAEGARDVSRFVEETALVRLQVVERLARAEEVDVETCGLSEAEQRRLLEWRTSLRRVTREERARGDVVAEP